ncbi:MAG: hypothetical protein QXY99_07670, partial [Thermoproteota archaeon]
DSEFDNSSISDEEFRDLIKKAYTDIFLTVYHLYKYSHERFHEVEMKIQALVKQQDRIHEDIQSLVKNLSVAVFDGRGSNDGSTRLRLSSIIAISIGAFIGVFAAVATALIIFGGNK